MTLCDSHIHVVADPAVHPMIPNRSYTPGIATIEDVQRLGAPHGVTRFVVVQPSFYGTDNTVLLEALGKLGPDGRGVAVLNPAKTTPAELARLEAAGVRGLRINLYSQHGETGGQPGEDFATLAALARTMGWHVQVIAPLQVLVTLAGQLAASPVPVVIDHYGLPAGFDPMAPEGGALLSLARHSHVWVKLSAPYRHTGDVLGVVPDAAWISALLDAAPERCVWGSDWPHTPAHEGQPGHGAPIPYRTLDYGQVVTAFRDAMPSVAFADSVMRDNAARLYAF